MNIPWLGIFVYSFAAIGNMIFILYMLAVAWEEIKPWLKNRKARKELWENYGIDLYNKRR